MNLELKRKLSKLLGENIVEEDDAVAQSKLVELFKENVNAELVKTMYAALSEDEKAKLQLGEPNLEGEPAGNQEDEEQPNDAEEPAEENDEEPNEGTEEQSDAQDSGADAPTDEEPVEEPSEIEKSEEEQSSVETSKDTSAQDELFDAKLEAALLRANVQEDKLESAKKLFKVDHTIEELDKVKEFVKEYPEWVKTKSKTEPKSFGIGVGEHDSSSSPTERRAKELGLI